MTNQGNVAAGNSIGTLTVNGNYTQAAGSAMAVEINNGGTTPGVNNDLVSVGGTTTLNGGTVNVNAAPGSYLAGTRYTFLTSTGGVSGAFAGATDNIAMLHAVLGYTGNSAYFTLTFDQTNFAAIAQTFNELAVATYLDEISTSATGDLQTVLTGLSTLSDDQQRAAFNQMDGEIYGSFAQIELQQTTLVLAQLSQRIRYGTLTEGDDGPILGSAQPAARSPVILASYSPTRNGPPVIAIVRQQPSDAWRGWAFGLGLGGTGGLTATPRASATTWAAQCWAWSESWQTTNESDSLADTWELNSIQRPPINEDRSRGASSAPTITTTMDSTTTV